MNAARSALVVAVVGEWFRARRAPRDAMAAAAGIRRQPAEVRAAVARAAAQVLAGQRWLAFAAGAEAAVEGLAPAARAALLVTAHERLSGTIDLEEARRRLGAAGLGPLDPAALATAEARCAALPDPTLRLAVRQSVPDWLAAEFVACHGARAEGLVGSSRVDLQACKLEYSIVSPK